MSSVDALPSPEDVIQRLESEKIDLEKKCFQLDLRKVELEKRLQEYETKISDIRDYVKRMEEEIKAIRERSERDLNKNIQQKLGGVLSSLLPVLDNFGLCIRASQNPSDPLLEGVKMVAKQYEETLMAVGLERIKSLGFPFDPALHEAIAEQTVESSDQDGKIVNELKAGYRFGGHIIRPAQVIVGKHTH